MPIEWLERPGYKPISWNPNTGCSEISEGCQHCYARRLAETRLRGKAGYPKDEPFRVTLHYDKLDQYTDVKKQHSIFINSMSDTFHDEVPDSFIAQIINRVVLAPQHLYFFLTKRPDRMVTLINKYFDFILEQPNVWFGVTAENQKRYDERVPVLCSLNTNNLFISCEPLLSDIDLRLSDVKLFPNRKPSWVIVGGESGPNCRKMELDWARNLRKQCSVHGMKYYLKQLGGWPDQRERSKAILDDKLYKELPI